MEGEIPKFLEMQECHNICMAAYKEFMTNALKENSWVKNVPALGDTEDLQREFRVPPSPGMKIEYSVASGVLPICLELFITIMTSANQWAGFFCDIVHSGTCDVAPGFMREFVPTGRAGPQSSEYTIKSLRVINAELLYPMPCGPPRKFSFIRFVKEVMPDVFAVVDVSTDYFPNFKSTYNANCKRRPSGVIVRKHGAHDENSEVIWIENMEVPECNVENSIYSAFKINQAFDAKRWMSMVSTQDKQTRSKFVTLKLPTTDYEYDARKSLLALAKNLKTKYLSYIAEYPKKFHITGWDILDDGGIKCWEDTHSQGKKKFTAVTIFRVKATPHSVFTFLVERTPHLQWPSLVETAEPEEVVNLLSDDESTCVVHAKRMNQTNSSEPQAKRMNQTNSSEPQAKRMNQTNSSEPQAKRMKPTDSGEQQATHLESPQDCEFVLQEASPDDYCSLVILSTPVDVQKFNSALQFKEDSYSLIPSGFSIMPDGSLGLLSDASIITMVWRQEHAANVVNGEVVERMSQFADSVIEMTYGAFPDLQQADEAMEP